MTSDSNNGGVSLSDLNVGGASNFYGPSPYSEDEGVRKNIAEKEKPTVPVTKELKTTIVIVAILLVFVILIPIIFDYVASIKNG